MCNFFDWMILSTVKKNKARQNKTVEQKQYGTRTKDIAK